MRHKQLKKALVITFLLGFLLYEIVKLHRKYGQLFYIQTFLPQPNLALQHRREDLTSTENSFTVASPKTKILCLIVTSPKYHQTRAVHVAATWARHCTRAIFLTSDADANLQDSYVISEAEGYSDLWQKVSKGFEWTYDQDLLSVYDWILKVDDDTFIFVEHLLSALEPYDPERLFAIGHQLYTWDTKEVYLNGGAGYVLSKATVKHLVSQGLKTKACESSLPLGPSEDVNMAMCLTYLGVLLVDLRDEEGNPQFHIYPPQEQIDPRQAYAWSHLWLKIISVNPNPFGFETISNKPISFHYVNAETMYLIYYFSYIANPYSNNDKRVSLTKNKQAK